MHVFLMLMSVCIAFSYFFSVVALLLAFSSVIRVFNGCTLHFSDPYVFFLVTLFSFFAVMFIGLVVQQEPVEKDMLSHLLQIMIDLS